jgi:uncharacterized membrane protein YfcA
MGRHAVVILMLFGAGSASAEGKKYSTLQEVSFEYLAGVGAAALTIPSMLAAGEAIGKSSPDLATALVPAILLQLIVPPVAVTLAEWAVGRYGLKDGSRFHPAIWVAVAVNLVGIVIGAAGGVYSGDALGNSLYTITNSLVMPLAVTGVMYAKRKRPPPPPAIPLGVEQRTGVLPAAMTFNLVKVSF